MHPVKSIRDNNINHFVCLFIVIILLEL